MAEAGAVAGDRGWLRRLATWLRPYRGQLVVAVAAALVAEAVAVAVPLVERSVVDNLGRHGRAGLALPVALLVAAGLFRFALGFVRRYWAGRVSAALQVDLRKETFAHVQRLDFARHDQLETGQLVSRANSDIGLVMGLCWVLPMALAAALFFALATAVMFFLNPLLAGVLLLFTPLLAVVSVGVRRLIFPAAWAAQQDAAVVAGVVDEAVSGVRVVKGFGQEDRELARLAEAAEGLYASRVRSVRISCRFGPLLQSIPPLSQVVVLALGGWLVIRGHMTLGSFLVFASYVAMLQAPVRLLVGVLPFAQQARAGAVRVLELLESTPGVANAPGATDLGPVEGVVEFDDVSFGYRRSAPVLDGFTLRVHAGETVALVGRPGCGKSTVGLLLPRFYDVQAGAVRVDGTDVRDVTTESLRTKVGVVFEDTFLFSDTVAANIAFGRPDATDEEVRAAARAAEADRFIEELPEGYATVVGERGLTLSGGQRQRIAIARALLTDPSVLVLDDATSSVDVLIEREIHATLRRLLATRTAVLIAHRQSTLELADRVCVIDDGRVLDSGSHDELLERCTLYRRLMAGAGDAETLTPDTLAPEGDDEAQIDGVSPSAWPAGAELGAADALGAVGRMGKAGPAAGPAQQAYVIESMAASPELLAHVAALPPAHDRPDVTVDEVAGGPGPFSFRRFLSRWRAQLAVALALVALDGLATLAGPVLVRYGIDRGVLPRAEHTLWLIAGVALAVVVADWAVMVAEVFTTGRTAERVLFALRVRIFAHLQRLGLDYYDREMAGRVMTRMTNDVEALTQLLQTGLVTALVSILSGAGVAVVLLVLDWRLALLTMTVAPPLAAATLWFRRNARRAYDQARDSVAAVNADFQESLSGVRVTQAFARERRNVRRFAGLALEYLRAQVRSAQVSATYFALIDLLSELAAAIVLGCGAALVSGGSLSPGVLIAFLLYLDLFFSPIGSLSQVLDTWQQAAVAVDRIKELLEAPVRTPAPARPRRPAGLRGEIAFDGVSFTYPETTAEVLHDVSLEVPAGQALALVGETGAGKSTIAKLIARFYDVTGGRVTVDGVDIREYDLTAYRRQLGIVPQEPYLFAGTVRDNIAYGRPEATDAEVEAAARAVGAHGLVRDLPGGYHHVIGSSGLTMSSGQRQLLALARAELVGPAIVLLDEATSNLDPATEAAVGRAMALATTGRTTVVIAHRLATAARADRIALIDHGRVVELGPHAELLRAAGRYASLWSTAPQPVPSV